MGFNTDVFREHCRLISLQDLIDAVAGNRNPEAVGVARKVLLERVTAPVDQAAVAEAWNAWLESQPMVDIEDFDDQTFSRNIARFVAELVAKGVPRKAVD